MSTNSATAAITGLTASSETAASVTSMNRFINSRTSSCGAPENVNIGTAPRRSKYTSPCTCGKKSTATRLRTPSSSHNRKVSSKSANCSDGTANNTSSITC